MSKYSGFAIASVVLALAIASDAAPPRAVRQSGASNIFSFTTSFVNRAGAAPGTLVVPGPTRQFDLNKIGWDTTKWQLVASWWSPIEGMDTLGEFVYVNPIMDGNLPAVQVRTTNAQAAYLRITCYFYVQSIQ